MKFKYYNKTVIPVLASVLVLRLIEMFLLMESDTLYYKTGDYFHYIFSGIYIIAVIFYLSSFFFLAKKNCGTEALGRLSALKRSMLFISGLLIMIATVITIVSDFVSGNINTSELFKSLDFYIWISSLLASVSLMWLFFFVEGGLNPQNIIPRISALFLPIYYILRLFSIYIDSEGLIAKTSETFEVFKVAFLTLCLMSFIKVYISDCARKTFTAMLWASSVFAAIRIADTVFYIINLPSAISISDIFIQISDILLVITLLMINVDFYKRRRKKENISTETIQTN